jgi:NADH-quinone oxidoreductase subunit C
MSLTDLLQQHFGEFLTSVGVAHGETTIEVAPAHYLAVCKALREHGDFQFQQLIDLCGVDYLSYGEAEWETAAVSSEGFSRGLGDQAGPGRLVFDPNAGAEMAPNRFAVVLHLLSVAKNQRLRVRVRIVDSNLPVVPTLTGIWAAANWYERETFDLYGILFDGHPDLRRLLTDYGFVGHPFRKDFPLVGHVEARFDAAQHRVVYEPVSIEPRVLVPKVVRKDSRYTN